MYKNEDRKAGFHLSIRTGLPVPPISPSRLSCAFYPIPPLERKFPEQAGSVDNAPFTYSGHFQCWNKLANCQACSSALTGALGTNPGHVCWPWN